MEEFLTSLQEIDPLWSVVLVGAAVAVLLVTKFWSASFARALAAVAGLIVPISTILIDLFGRVDDPAGGVAVHGVGGAWGLIAGALFAPASFSDHLKHVGANLLAIVVLAVFAGGFGFGLFALLRSTVGVR